jgi:uncharacterized protein YggU (UPF0235/DUF167 family)
MLIYQIHPPFIELKVWVKPGASRNSVLTVTERGLALSVCAKAHDGEANLAVCKLLADYLVVPKTSLKILKGTQGRQKIIQIPYSQAVLEKIQAI